LSSAFFVRFAFVSGAVVFDANTSGKETPRTRTAKVQESCIKNRIFVRFIAGFVAAVFEVTETRKEVTGPVTSPTLKVKVQESWLKKTNVVRFFAGFVAAVVFEVKKARKKQLGTSFVTRTASILNVKNSKQ